MKTEPRKVQLKNLYTDDMVWTDNYNDTNKINEVEFILVYKESNPQRKYFVNRLAFEVLTK
jgi:hypothetical protein